MTVLALSGAALAIRVITLLLTFDWGGDGPTRAMQAYEWSRHPHVVTHGVWLPGFMYWAGIASLIIPSPLIASRLTNVVLGTLTIPVFYVLIRRLYGAPTALLSSVTLAVLPLHVGLSVSSMTEPSFLFFIIVALVCLAGAVEERSVRIRPLGLFLLFFVLAEMTRYESWPLIPLLLAYLYWRSRSAWTLLFSAVILLILPIGWSLESYVHSGNAFEGFLLGTHPLEGGGAVSPPTAIANVVWGAARYLGWPLLVAILWGLTTGFAPVLRGILATEQTAYAILVGVIWIMIVAGARSLGPALYGRYLLTGCVLALPLAAVPYLRHWGHYRHSVAIGVLAGIGSVSLAYVVYHPSVWVTRTQPAEIVELASWLRESPYRDAGVVLTRMNWLSTYLPLYLPEPSGRYFIVSVWVDDGALGRFIAQRKPALLITQAEDAPYRTRIERVLGRVIPTERRVYSAGRVEAYDLSN